LRAMAGFNEIDMFLGYLVRGETPTVAPVRFGWYLRSLSESFVSEDGLR
jgi:carbamoyl-phosphate synthase large subunit